MLPEDEAGCPVSDFCSMTLVQLKPRKPCIWCGDEMPSKGSAIRVFGKWEGSIYSGHMHLECKEAFDRQDSDVLCDGCDFYGFVRGSTRFKGEPLGAES